MSEVHQGLLQIIKEENDYSLDKLKEISESQMNNNLYSKLFLILILRIRETSFEDPVDSYNDISRCLNYISKILSSNSFIKEEKLKKNIKLFNELIDTKLLKSGNICDDYLCFLKKIKKQINEDVLEYIPRFKAILKYEKKLKREQQLKERTQNEKKLKEVRKKRTNDSNPVNEDCRQGKEDNLNIFSSPLISTPFKIITIDDYVSGINLIDKLVGSIDDNSNVVKIDDALSLDILTDGTYMLGVHVADVSAYLLKRNLLYDQTFADLIAKSLEESRTNYIGLTTKDALECSLLHGQYRPTVSCFMKIDSKGDLIDFSIRKTTIKSKYQLCRDSAYDLLCAKKTSNYELQRKLLELAKLTHLLKYKEPRRTYKDTDLKQSFVYNNKAIGNEIVANTIPLVGYCIGQYFKEQSLPIIYKRKGDDYCRTTSPLKKVLDRINQMIIYELYFCSIRTDSVVYKWEENVKQIESSDNVFIKHPNNCCGKR